MIPKQFEPHCYKCGYDIKVMEVDELKVHVKNLQKLLGNYALHVEDCEGVDFLSPTHGRNEFISESDKDYISNCKEALGR